MPGRPDTPFLVISYSATDPGRVLRYTPATKKLSTLFLNRPWVEPAKMSETVAFDYKARDGLPIMAYLTLPKGRTPKKLPLIILPHGGPTGRDFQGFDPVTQFLANRGYAVLQPQFRGSTGFGIEHMKKGFRQWGMAMQDDLSDGMRNLVAQGLVDPQRVCIMGASYGGYATMMGLAKEPEQYKCGINLMGVTDLTDLLKQGRWAGDAFRYQSKLMIGDLATMRAQIEQTSPVNRAADIRAPVFMAYGEKDRRVPLSHGTDMRDALKKAGKAHEWMSFPNEEHGFAHEENRFKVFNGIDTFLGKYNPAD
jgi:dipeptidyl aminopeptidase/acylaminoacyl peptidase